MIVYHDINTFTHTYQQSKSVAWERCLQSFDMISTMQKDVYYSLGDSLVYRLYHEKSSSTHDDFVGHRMYFDVHYYLKGSEFVEYAEKKSLQVKIKYDDTTDREYFSGTGNTREFTGGDIVVYENDEAYKYYSDNEVKKLIVKITIQTLL